MGEEEHASTMDDVAETSLHHHHHATKGIRQFIEDGPKLAPYSMIKKCSLKDLDFSQSAPLYPRLLDLDRALPSLKMNEKETPLHIAARLGDLDFARESLLRNPGFATDLNQDGDSPLHLAAANGFVEIVRELSKVMDQEDMCFLRDKNGRTALHRAAIEGRLEVINELLKVCPESLLDAKTARGDTPLHLALAYRQTMAFRLLVEWVILINKKELLNWKDREGNTVLHVATSRKQLQPLQVLLDGKMISIGEVEVNALNAYGLTALDIMYVLPQNLGERIDMEIEDVLRRAGGLRAMDIESQPPHSLNQVVINSGTALSHKSPAHKFQETRKDSPSNVPMLVRSAMLVVVAMFATVPYLAVNSSAWKEVYNNQSYQNSTSQPLTQNLNSKPISFTMPMSIHLFAVFNSACFFTSIAMMIVLISGFPFRAVLLIAPFSLLVSYMCLITAMLPTEVLFVLILAIPFVSFAVTQYIFPRGIWGSGKLFKFKWRNLVNLDYK